MWAPPSSRITELSPTIGCSTLAPSPGRRTSGGAVNTCLICSGSVIITNGGANGNFNVNRLPYRARQRSRKARGLVQKPTIWIAEG
jgi:hypothetical protein